MDALSSHTLPQALCVWALQSFVFRALAQGSEQPPKQVTPAFVRGEPGAQREHVTDLGQSPCPEARPVAVHYTRAQQCDLLPFNQTLRCSKEHRGNTRGSSRQPASSLFGELGPSELARAPGRSTNNKKGPGLRVKTLDSSARSLGSVP